MITGIICEFNPFHKGHKYLIDTVKKDGGAVVCVMSSSFVQRGECAVFSKFDRAKTALENGADLVIELPSEYSTLSAQGFARAGCALLEATGICDSIAFGCECADADELIMLSNEIKERDGEIKIELEKGVSYPKARQNVIASPLLEEPNNILAVEYLSNTDLKPIAVKRIGKGHDSDDSEYSASEIRKTLPKDKAASIYNIEKAILFKLRTMSAEDFSRIDDVSEGLENRIYEAVQKAEGLDSLYSMIKTKRYTHSRIRRIVLRAFLGINSSLPKTPSYIRILGFTPKGKELLGKMKKSAMLPLITKYAQAKSEGGEVLAAFERESRYTDVFNLCFQTPKPCGEDMKRKIITVNDR